MRISMIAAMANNRVIGKDGDLPWHLPDDLRHFKQTTLNHPVLMGRKTLDEVLGRIGKPLPGRRNLVLSRDRDLAVAGAETFADLDEAIGTVRASGAAELFIIGGGQIYRLAMPHAERMYLTRVEAEVEGDTRFPQFDQGWQLVSQEHHPADERHAHAFRFELWERQPAAASDERPAQPNGR